MKKPDIGKEELDSFILDPSRPEYKELEDAFFKDVEPWQLIAAHAGDEDILDEISGHYSRLYEAYDRSKHPREALEWVCTAKLDVIGDMAARFNPFSSYGKEMLSQYADCRREFERKAGYLTSNISKNNAGIFSSVISADIRDEIETGKCFAIGAIRSDGNDSYGVGALAYYYDEDMDGETVLRVKWLYVDEDWRKRGIARALMIEILYIASVKNISAVSVDFEVGEYQNTFGNILTQLHFDFSAGVSPESALTIGDVSRDNKLSGYADRTTVFSELADIEASEAIRRFLEKNGYKGFLAGSGIKEGYIDKDTSCFIGKPEAPEGMLLSHKYPSGRIGIEYAGCINGKEDKIEILFGSFITEALYKYDKNTEIIFNTADMDTGIMLDELFPKQKVRFLIEGVLVSPEKDRDITKGIVEYLVEGYRRTKDME